MTHAQGILAQLRQHASDDDLPDDIRERNAERAAELAELEEEG